MADKDKEVQANSVIFSRKNYILLLEDAKRAYGILAPLRAIQIEAWRNDIKSREKDLDGLLTARYIYRNSYDYDEYLAELAKPTTHAWWKKVLGIRPVVKVDEYGSVVEFVSKINGTNFEEYKATEIASAMSLYGDRVEVMRRFATNAHDFLHNEWTGMLKAVTATLAEVEFGNIDAQFIIPREAFDEYTAAMLLAESGTIEEVEGRVYPNRGWYVW